MHDQPSYSPLEPSEFFADGMSARAPVEGTVARGQLRLDKHLYEGRVDGQFAESFPFAIDRAGLDRGHERFDVFCSACHGRVGDGAGMVAQRGFRRPPTLHDDRLRTVPPGYLYDVITNGFGAMWDYSAQVDVRDRWLIVAYLRALQLSQHTELGDAPAPVRQRLGTN